MLDTVREKCDSLLDYVHQDSWLDGDNDGSWSERFSRDVPDGRNPGIDYTESIATYAAAIAATFMARQLLQKGWQTTFDRDPPLNPSSHEVAWREALMWGAVSGALVGVTRILSRRATSSAYQSFGNR